MLRRLLGLLTVAVAVVVLGAVGPVPVPALAASPPGVVAITGVDLHDGMVAEFAGVFYLYGTQYGCGYQWQVASTHWCGFGVSSAPSPSGPWSPVITIVAPSSVDPWSGRTWDQQCQRTNGAGCFNPRMVQRPDGAWILWFNAVDDYLMDGANGYNVEGCNSPVGPCGPTAGPPYGSYNKPQAWTCGAADGDESIITDGATAYLECTGANRSEYVEQLDQWWANGTGNLAGHGTPALLSNVEGPGMYHDPGSGLWVSTVSSPECGYCAGSATVYMTASSPLGPWSIPANVQVLSDPVGYARATISGSSCGGQPRTVDILDGQPYQQVDLWLGTRGEANAGTLLVPLNFRSPANVYGVPWQPFDPWLCG